MNKADRALERVQNLYVMQFQLLDLLDKGDLSDPLVRKEMRTQLKQFEDLLARADWRYMGGMDVWDALKSLPDELAKKLRMTASITARARKILRKPSRAAAKTKVAVKKTKSKAKKGGKKKK